MTKVTAADGSYTEFSYDADGIRTQKRQYTADGEPEYYVNYVWQDGLLTHQSMTYYFHVTLNGTEKVVELPFTAKFVYDESNTPVGCLVNDEMALAFVRNLQGDIIAVVNQEGTALLEYSYDPWGKVTITQNGENLTEQERQIIAVLCPFAYRGYNYDFTTGLYYLQSRYYNPEWGRFLNVDDTNILLSTQGENLGANLFAYCNNNPVNKADYSGYNSQPLNATSAFLYGLYAVVMVERELNTRGLSYLLNYKTSYDWKVDFQHRIIKLYARFYVSKKTFSEEYYAVTASVGLVSDWWDYRCDEYNFLHSNFWDGTNIALSVIGFLGVIPGALTTALSFGISGATSISEKEIEELTQVIQGYKSDEVQLMTVISEVTWTYNQFFSYPGEKPTNENRYINKYRTYIFSPSNKRVVKS